MRTKYLTTDEIEGPWYIAYSDSNSPIVLGKASVCNSNTSSLVPHLSGISMATYWGTEIGQQLSVNLLFCKSWSDMTKEQTDYLLNLMVQAKAKRDEANAIAITKEASTLASDKVYQEKLKKLIDASLRQVEDLEDSEKWKHE